MITLPISDQTSITGSLARAKRSIFDAMRHIDDASPNLASPFFDEGDIQEAVSHLVAAARLVQNKIDAN